MAVKVPKACGFNFTCDEFLTIDPEVQASLYFFAHKKADYVRGIRLFGTIRACVEFVNAEINRYSCRNFATAWHFEYVQQRICQFYGLKYSVGGRVLWQQ